MSSCMSLQISFQVKLLVFIFFNTDRQVRGNIMPVCACFYPTILYQPADPRSRPSRYHDSIGQSTSNPYSLFKLITRARQARYAGRRRGARNTKLWPGIQKFDRRYKNLIEDTKFRLEIQSFHRKYDVLFGNTKMWREIQNSDRKCKVSRNNLKRYHSEYLQKRMLKWVLKKYDGCNSINMTYNNDYYSCHKNHNFSAQTSQTTSLARTALPEYTYSVCCINCAALKPI
jgi:hypothetical protein